MERQTATDASPIALAASGMATPPVDGPRGLSRTHLTLAMATVGLVIGLWMAVLLGNTMAPDPSPVADTSGLEQDLTGLRSELAALNRSLADAKGRLDASSRAYCSTAELVDGVQGQLDSMNGDLQGLLVLIGDQDERLASIRERLDSAQAELDRTMADLIEARLKLDYAQGRLNGSQVYVNLSLDQMAGVLAQLVDVIAELAEAQAQLSDAIADLIASQGGEVPEGIVLGAPHLAHYESSYLFFTCRMCHNTNVPGNLTVYSSRLYYDGNLTGTGFTAVMNRTTACSKCHDDWPSKMPSSYKTRDCTANDCHDEWRAEMKSPYVNESNITKDNCLLCHGGQPFYPR